MKIAFDAKRMLNNAAGLGNHARILVNAMMRDFPENEYLFFSPKAQDPFLDQLHGKYEIVLPQSRFSKMLHPWWRSYGITEQLLRDMVDIYHGLSNELPLNIHRSGIRSVVTIHDIIFLKHKEQYPRIDRQVYDIKTKYAAKHADRIIAVSEETKQDLIGIYKVPEKKIAVIYPSVDPLFYQQRSAEEKHKVKGKYHLPDEFLLNVSSFYSRKNHIRLIEAFDMIKEKIQESLILVGGQGNLQAEVLDLIRSKNLQSRIQIITNISNEDLPAVYQSASAFVFPSLFEGFGAPVLEALYSGVPVIAARGGAIAEAAGRDSLFMDPLDPRDIADKIMLVSKDNGLRTKMIAAGYEHAKDMRDDAFARKTMEVYMQIAG